jgi:hypothetical protein
MKLRITFGSAFALVMLVVVFAIGAAPASSTGSSHYTHQGLKADGLRLQAMARRYKWLQNHRPAASFYTREALNAMGLRWLAMARSYARPQVASVSTGGRFDWADAGIGAATGSALALCLVALIAIARRPRETKLAA